MYNIDPAELRPWWNLEGASKNSMHEYVYKMAMYLRDKDDDRQRTNIQSLRLYGNNNISGFFPSYAMTESPINVQEARLKYNIISSTVDTVHSKIGKMKPRITFLTSGGAWSEQQKAKKLTKWVDGAFYNNDVHAQHTLAFRDACVFDCGVLKHFIKNGKICTERVLPTELVVDQMDAVYGKPTHIYHIRYRRRDELMKEYPAAKAAIMRAGQNDPSMHIMRDDQMSEFIEVVEAWKLRSGPEADDGIHTLCIEGACLYEEQYDKDYFPFTFVHWVKPMMGFWGQSLANRLTGNQLEINKMLRTIQRSFHLGSAFKVFLEYGSKVAREHLNNEIGSIIYYSGTRPDFYVPQTVHPEFFQFLEWLIQSSYEEAGISQLSATSQKPADLESGRALREYNNIETERFAVIAQAYEKSFLDTAKIYLDLARELYKEHGVNPAMSDGSKKFVKSIKWSDVAMEEDEYIMKMYPTSMLPTEPAGRIATIQDWVNTGMIPPEEGMRLLDFPDIEEYRAFQNSPIDDMHFVFDFLMNDPSEEILSPDPFEDLAGCISFMKRAYLRARVEGAPEERLDLVRTWIDQAVQLDEQRKQAAQEAEMQAMMAAQGGMPTGPGAGPQMAQNPAEGPIEPDMISQDMAMNQ